MFRSERTGLRLVLADDHDLVRQGLRALLEREGFIVAAEARDGRAAVAKCIELKPEVAVLDVGMPVMNGIEAAREIRACSGGTRIVLLTMHTEDACVLAGLRAGTTAYVLKTDAAACLVTAIDSACRNQTFLSPDISRAVAEAFVSKAVQPTDPLSAREREVLQLVAEGFNVKEIGALLGISARTAETHRTRIMAKLNIHEVAGLVWYAIQHRLVTVPPQFQPTRNDSEPGD